MKSQAGLLSGSTSQLTLMVSDSLLLPKLLVAVNTIG
jgi:hypothetical protein